MGLYGREVITSRALLKALQQKSLKNTSTTRNSKSTGFRRKKRQMTGKKQNNIDQALATFKEGFN
jgi:hypothetical protein